MTAVDVCSRKRPIYAKAVLIHIPVIAMILFHQLDIFFGYPAEHQGLAMGIAGAGNSGTLIATFFGPRIAQHYGWHFVFGLALVPIALVLAAFFFLAKNSPSKSAPKPWGKYAQLFTQADTWKLCFLYSLTFGGFVGLASFLSVFFHDQYHLTKVQAGDFTTVVVLAGSF